MGTINLLNREIGTYCNGNDPGLPEEALFNVRLFHNIMVEHIHNCVENNPVAESIMLLNSYISFISYYLSDNDTYQLLESVYKKISSPLKGDNYIDIVDNCKAFDIYQEYIDGMLEYLDELEERFAQGESVIQYEEVVKAIKETMHSDKEFIEQNLFGGKNSKVCKLSHVRLKYAVHNIEFLVPFSKQILDMENILLNKTQKSDGIEEEQPIRILIQKLLGSSLTTFVAKVIENTIQTLNAIIKSSGNIQIPISEINTLTIIH